jgi:hypothetical protein
MPLRFDGRFGGDNPLTFLEKNRRIETDRFALPGRRCGGYSKHQLPWSGCGDYIGPGATYGVVHGFVRAPDGTVTTIDGPEAIETKTTAINSQGTTTGFYFVGNNRSHGFLRAADGSFTTFDVPGAVLTTPTGIDSKGMITGWYGDAVSPAAHGFLRQ